MEQKKREILGKELAPLVAREISSLGERKRIIKTTQQKKEADKIHKTQVMATKKAKEEAKRAKAETRRLKSEKDKHMRELKRKEAKIAKMLQRAQEESAREEKEQEKSEVIIEFLNCVIFFF